MNHAIIDLGSNTIRMSIYRCDDNGFAILIRQKEFAGLASHVKNGWLDEEGIEKACCTLSAFKEIAARFIDEEKIHLFATASLRGIRNQTQALEAIRHSCNILPEVLSGEEEARLAFVGASHFTDCNNGVLFDIGGASTEFILFQDTRPIKLASMPIGCLNLSGKFVSKVIPTKKECEKIKNEIHAQINTHITWKDIEDNQLIIGVGGTVRAAHNLSCALFAQPAEQQEIKSKYIKKILNRIKNNENEIYRTIYRLVPERTLTIYTGLMILNKALKKFNCKNFFVSNYGVREGYLIDRVLKENRPCEK